MRARTRTANMKADKVGHSIFIMRAIIFVNLIVNMDNSQLETSTNNALLEIQRAQRVLDETEQKMKRFKKEKESASKPIEHEFRSSPVPDLREYLSYLIDQDQENQDYNRGGEEKEVRRLGSTKQIRTKGEYLNLSNEGQLHNYKKTEKAERSQYKNKGYPPIPNQNLQAYQQQLDIRKHTQEQLQKSHIVRLERIQEMYKQQFETLDTKIEDLLKNRQKIKKDKVLLLRDNEELERNIEIAREKKALAGELSQSEMLLGELRAELGRLQKKLAKIELENAKIVKRKAELEVNMRVCIRNSKEQLAGDIAGTRLRENKSKSNIVYKCPYH